MGTETHDEEDASRSHDGRASPTDEGRASPIDEGRASRIRAAAKQLFIDKGYDGTTMQSIADASRVNKALLHYYFESKDRLFLLIFREELAELSDTMAELWKEGGRPLTERFEAWIDTLVAFLERSPRLPLFIIAEMARNPELIKELIAEFSPPAHILSLADTKRLEGRGPGLPVLVELVEAIYSLILFPAVAAPMIRHFLGVDEALERGLRASQARLAKDLVRRRLGGDSTETGLREAMERGDGPR